MNRMIESVAAGHGESEGERSDTGRIYYGWIILSVSTAAMIATSPGQTFGVSVFNEHMRTALALTHSQRAAAYMLGTLLAALPLTAVGALMDRHGPRRATIATVILFGLACIGTSLVNGWIFLLFAFFFLRLLGPGALAFLSSNTLAFWFHRRLGTAEGVRQFGYALALIIIPVVYLWLVQHFGWRASYLALGLVVWAVMLPLVLGFVYDRPDEVGQRLDGGRANGPAAIASASADSTEWGFTLGEALRSRTGWIVASGTALYSLIHTAIFFSILPICHDRGLSDADAAGLLSAFAVSLAMMQLLGGALADRLTANWLLCAGMAGLALAMAAVFMMAGAWSARVAGAVLGLSQGLFFATSSPLWARYFGTVHIGKIRGMLATVNVGASSVGPFLAGLSRDHLGSFDPAVLAFAIAPLPLALLSLLATPPVRSPLRSQAQTTRVQGSGAREG